MTTERPEEEQPNGTPPTDPEPDDQSGGEEPAEGEKDT